jgi:hypothetical protein
MISKPQFAAMEPTYPLVFELLPSTIKPNGLNKQSLLGALSFRLTQTILWLAPGLLNAKHTSSNLDLRTGSKG